MNRWERGGMRRAEGRLLCRKDRAGQNRLCLCECLCLDMAHVGVRVRW